MKRITASVGHRGKNNSTDVRIIQELLIQKGFVIGQVEFIRDGGFGTCGPITISAIRMLQSTFLAKSDGIITPNGESLKRLNNYNGHYLNQSNIIYTLKIVRDKPFNKVINHQRLMAVYLLVIHVMQERIQLVRVVTT